MAAGVAVASLGLFTLAVAFGWLGPDVDRGAVFCEVSDGPLEQPVNTLSNLGFVVAGLAIAVRAGRPGGLGRSTMARMPGLATAYACLVVLLGPGSMAMHATESAVGGHLDMLSMYLVAAFAASYAAMRRWRRGPAFLAVAYVGAVVACELVGGSAGTCRSWTSPATWRSGRSSSSPWCSSASTRRATRAPSTCAGWWRRSPRWRRLRGLEHRQDRAVRLLPALGLPGPRRVAPAVRGVGVLPVPALRQRERASSPPGRGPPSTASAARA